MAMTRPCRCWRRGKTITGRLWTYVRDDRPFGGPAPPAAIFYYSRDRGGEHPRRHLAGYSGILQADAYAGFNDLYPPLRKPVPLIEAGCWAHGTAQLLQAGGAREGAIGGGSRATDRRHLRCRAPDQRTVRRAASGGRVKDRVAPLVERTGDIGCALHVASCRATLMSRRRWITC